MNDKQFYGEFSDSDDESNKGSNMKSIAKIMAEYPTENRLFAIGQYLKSQLKVSFTIQDNKKGDSCFIANNIKDKKESLKKELGKIKEQLNYGFNITEEGEEQLIIDRIDPSILSDEKNRKDAADFVQTVLQNLSLEENLPLTIDTSDEQVTITDFQGEVIIDIPTVSPIKQISPVASQNNVSMQSLTDFSAIFGLKKSENPILLKQDLKNIEKMQSLIQATRSLDSLRVENKPFLETILIGFYKYQELAKQIVFELICRGDITKLKTFLNIEIKGTVEKKTSIKSTFTSKKQKLEVTENSEIKEKTITEKSSYILRANFDPYDFACYVVNRKDSDGQVMHLNLRENVEKCIKLVCGEDNQEIAANLIFHINKLKIYNTLDDAFSAVFAKK